MRRRRNPTWPNPESGSGTGRGSLFALPVSRCSHRSPHPPPRGRRGSLPPPQHTPRPPSGPCASPGRRSAPPPPPPRPGPRPARGQTPCPRRAGLPRSGGGGRGQTMAVAMAAAVLPAIRSPGPERRSVGLGPLAMALVWRPSTLPKSSSHGSGDLAVQSSPARARGRVAWYSCSTTGSRNASVLPAPGGRREADNNTQGSGSTVALPPPSPRAPSNDALRGSPRVVDYRRIAPVRRLANSAVSHTRFWDSPHGPATTGGRCSRRCHRSPHGAERPEHPSA